MEEITYTEFPESGNTISTKEPRASQWGKTERLDLDFFFSVKHIQSVSFCFLCLLIVRRQSKTIKVIYGTPEHVIKL